MPKYHWLISLAAIALPLGAIPTPVSGQALLPYAIDIQASELERHGLALTQDAVQLVRFEQFDQAIPRAKLATQLAPNLYEPWFILGSLYVQQDQLDEGIKMLEKARSIAPQEPGIFFTLGSAYFQKEEYPKALRELEAGLKIDPNNVDALFDLGNTYLMLDRYGDAINSFQGAVERRADFWPAINNIGLVKYEQGDIPGAIREWEASIKIDPQAAESKLAMAVARFAQGQTEAALALGRDALNTDRNYADLDFLKKNLWGDRLLADAKRFLATPQIQAVISRGQ